MRRFFFNNSHFIDQAFYAFIGFIMTMAFGDTIAEMKFDNLAIEQQAFAKIAIMLCFFVMIFFVMHFTAKQTIRAGLGISSAINQSLLRDGDSVHVKLQSPKREFSGSINLQNSSSDQFSIFLPTGKEIIVPVHNIIKIFDVI